MFGNNKNKNEILQFEGLKDESNFLLITCSLLILKIESSLVYNHNLVHWSYEETLSLYSKYEERLLKSFTNHIAYNFSR